MNYNFKLLWERECMPLMKTAQIKKSIRNGINGYVKNERITFIEDKLTDEEKNLEFINNSEYKIMLKEKEKEPSIAEVLARIKNYEKQHYPIHYAMGDMICDMEDEIEERIVPYLIERGILKQDINEPINSVENDDYDDYDCIMNDYMESDNYKKYQEYKNKIADPYFNAERDKDYRYYCAWGGCHWWNPHFGLQLAKMVMPNIKWKILKGKKHTTVISQDKKLVFDILYFDEKDSESFGGKNAIDKATD